MSAAWILLSFSALAAPPAGVPVFRDVTERSGVTFHHVSGTPDKDFIYEVNGSGVALFDADGDSDLDLFLVNGSVLSPGPSPPRDALFRNEGSLKFVDVTGAAGVGDPGWGCGAAVADVENDGDLDLYVTNWGPNSLFLNRGDGTFRAASNFGAEDPGMSTSSSFGDFNRDGLVDLYVASYIDAVPASAGSIKGRSSGDCRYKGIPIFCGPGGQKPAPHHLYLNAGQARFVDASSAWGVTAAGAAYGLGTLVLDVNRDGWLDVVVANDTMRNFCFLGDEGKRFREAGLFLGLAYNEYGVAQAGMGLASANLLGKGSDEIFLTTFEDDTNTLFARDSSGLYSDSGFAVGVAAESYTALGWGALFLDVELDGDLDLFVANGHVAPQADQLRSSPGYRQLNHLFVNDGGGRLRRLDPGVAGLDVKESSRGAAGGDLDGDGDVDVVVSNMDAPPTILENTLTGSRTWVAIVLRGNPSNRAAIGARVTLDLPARHPEATLQSGHSYASQSELVARFGLGEGESPTGVMVEWPSGRKERFPPPHTGRVTPLEEGSGERLP